MQTDWKVVGHRGYAAKYPENTFAGFDAALALGVDAIEMDIQLTRDGVPVVIHDLELDRTSDSKGSLADLDFAKIANVSCHFPRKFGLRFAPQYLQSLEQVSQRLLNSTALTSETKVFIEIKKESIGLLPREAYLTAVLQASACLGERRIIISFDEQLVALARRQTQLLTGWCIDDFSAQTKATAHELKADMLICSTKMPGEEPLWPGPAECSWEWFVYGVETREQARHWAERGARWIEADDPAAVLIAK